MSFSTMEAGLLVGALDRAPSVHNTQPWELTIGDRVLELHERPGVALPRHDPTGRDRLLSCGAALANLELAVRALGRAVKVAVLPVASRPRLVARLRVGAHADVDEAGAAQYAAIFRRRSYRAPFALHDPGRGLLRRLAASAVTAETTETAETADIGVHVVHDQDEVRAMADLLSYAAGVLHDDQAYQRELSAWTSLFPSRVDGDATLPWAGLVQATTQLPDRITLYNRLTAEAMLVVHTATDTRRDHVLAGAVLQRLWLAAVAQGMVGSVLTQPLQLPEVRLGVAGRLHLPGHPQALFRTGYPVTGVPAGAVPVIAYGDDAP